MDIAFLDTNALMKLYIPEPGSIWLSTFVSNRQIIISELALIEISTVLRRLYSQGLYTRSATINLINHIEGDSITFEIIEFGGDLFRDRLTNLIFRLGIGIRIRALDAIHLTCAAIALADFSIANPISGFTFVSSDRQLLQAALSEGFTVENPENYP